MLHKMEACHNLVRVSYSSLTSMSTPAGRSSCMRRSTVWELSSCRSMSRKCVRRSNCSRLSLLTCGDRSTVYTRLRIGSGTGPDSRAPAGRRGPTVLTVLKAAAPLHDGAPCCA
jgi:hypothetical protein